MYNKRRLPLSDIGMIFLTIFLAAAYYLIPSPYISIPLLLLFAVMCWLRTDIVLTMLPLSFPFYLVPKNVLGRPHTDFALSEILLITCLAVVLLKSLVSLHERKELIAFIKSLWEKTQPFGLPLLLLFLLACASLVISHDRQESLRALRWYFIEPALYFLLLLRYLQRRKDIMLLIIGFAGAAVIISIIGIGQGAFHVFSPTVSPDGGGIKARGPYGSPNNLAIFLDRALPTVLALGFYIAPSAYKTLGRYVDMVIKDKIRVAAILISVLLGLATYYSSSGGALIALTIDIFILALLIIRRRVLIFGVAGIAALGILLKWNSLYHLLRAGHAGTIARRVWLWLGTLHMIRDHFLTGVGLDNFLYYYSQAAHPYIILYSNGVSTLAGYEPDISHPHNLILGWWVNLGIFGLSIFIWLLYLIFKECMCQFKAYSIEPPQCLMQRVVLGITLAMVSLVVHGMVDNDYFVPDLALMLWMFIAILLVSKNKILPEITSYETDEKTQGQA